ncbi:3-deoxy-manno-octulosonate cytidylyltransferase [Flagellatimonas centrodinii]|uniref:3-deoxy-manno-octulosonate cytidylyltransferase n=1 Tax=Flagellatimonas centrodinii TaxID=2806210 RepID=UPI001FEF61CB|nr:3-deoxy-manno-octulosonate cytidylyltransferase [Flagellatimonas centrodinii]ULQ47014.1 3-deoxy-manno-octulosonate cytidylyltransferase [Flagellatimonas centrodinii]
MTTPFKVVIPARLGSTRLPGKVLRNLAGKPMVEHVWRAACGAGADEVIVATDDQRVADACAGFGAQVCMTRADHASGTDRLHEVATQRRWHHDTLLVNLQGDEPLMPPALLRQAAALLADDADADIATLAHPLHDDGEFADPNVVKVVQDLRGYALYFSRAPIPHRREGSPARPAALALRHIGLYAYRVGALARFAALPPAELETCEALEQLRALAHGLRIRLGVIETPPPRGVDTEADLAAVEARLSAAAHS